MGIDASGNRLDPVMPRFELSLADAADLVAYLKRLDSLPEPGLYDRSLVVGTVLRQGESDIGGVLAAYFDEINQSGGLFGRQLVLQVVGSGESETPGSAVARLAAADTVFALIAPMIAGDEATAVATVDAGGVPTIGPITPRTQAAPRSREGFYLNGGVEAEGRALADFAARDLGTPAIVADASALWQGAAQAAAMALTNTGTPPRPMLPDDPNVAVAIGGGGPVLWLAEGTLARSAVAEFAGKPTLLLPSALADDLLANGAPVPTYVAFASGPADLTSEAAAEFRVLAARGELAPRGQSARDRSAQRFALAAAKVLVEALRRAGRAVTRERLVNAIEGLRNYQTGLLPPVSFSPSRHVGTDGVWIVPLDGSAAIWWTK
jgi:ABC-type branched-subunit amino acid transport system substrate-binding protein